VKRLQVRFSAEAAEQLAGLHRRRQGMLKRELERVAGAAPAGGAPPAGGSAPAAGSAPGPGPRSGPGSGPAGRIVRVRTPMDIAACEVLEDEGLVLVYAVIPRRELLQRLWGSEVDRRVRHREVARLMRGRWD
jgi:hypothetical protein